MAQVVEQLPSEYKALSSNSNTTNKQKQNKKMLLATVPSPVLQAGVAVDKEAWQAGLTVIPNSLM
jgi:hypothetical protein